MPLAFADIAAMITGFGKQPKKPKDFLQGWGVLKDSKSEATKGTPSEMAEFVLRMARKQQEEHKCLQQSKQDSSPQAKTEPLRRSTP